MFTRLRDWLIGSPLPERRRWALALGGMLAHAHHEPFDRLTSNYPARQGQKILAEWWSITDLASAQRTCEWLRSSGHSAVAAGMLPQAQALGPKQGQLLIVEQNLSEIQQKGLAAWDVGRLSVVVRWCFSAGCMSEEEAWEQIEAELLRVQKLYASWEEFGHGFLLGYKFWNTGPLDERFLRSHTWLLSHPESPWKGLAWDTDLRSRSA